MTFDEYQKQALTTARNTYEPLMERTIWAMGVAGEAGEVVEKWKKIVAYKDGVVSKEDLAELAKELGDVVWYIAEGPIRFCSSAALRRSSAGPN